MNHITLIARLTADPELTAPKGNPICRFRIAVDRTGTDGADYISIVSFGTRGENDARWLTKGRLVAIAGRLHHNTWTDNDGNNRERYEVYANTVTYLDGPRTKTASDANSAPGQEES
jgi:single-strand DNA-binding protein